jgi:hypothetical protein
MNCHSPVFFAFLVTIISVVPVAAQSSVSNAAPVILLIHGRDQPTGATDQTSREWKTALEKGLQLAKFLGRIPPQDQRFIWYTDIIAQKRGCTFGFTIPTDLSDELQRKLRNLFLNIEAQMPNAAERKLLEWRLTDTETYLSDAKISCAVENLVESSLLETKGAPVIVIAHSMGSMIFYKVLMQRAVKTQPIFLITIGSMIAQPTVQRTLLGSHSAFPAPVPPPVVWWRNVINTGDMLAFPAAAAFYSQIPSKKPTDIKINTHSADPHSATEYLRTREIGDLVRQAWCSAKSNSPNCN